MLDSVGPCFNDALSARTFRRASDGMLQRKQGLVLQIGYFNSRGTDVPVSSKLAALVVLKLEQEAECGRL